MMKTKNPLHKMCDEGAYLCTIKNGSSHIVANPVTYRKLFWMASESAERLNIDIDEETQEVINRNDELYIRWNIGIDAEKRDQTHYIVVAPSAEEARKKINEKSKDIYTISTPTTHEVAQARITANTLKEGH